MQKPIVEAQKRSSFNFMKITVYDDRLETKNMFFPTQVYYRKDIVSWTEINKKLRNNPLQWLEFTVYTSKRSYTIRSMHWNNYTQLRDELIQNVPRDTEKEKKIYKSFW